MGYFKTIFDMLFMLTLYSSSGFPKLGFTHPWWFVRELQRVCEFVCTYLTSVQYIQIANKCYGCNNNNIYVYTLIETLKTFICLFVLKLNML